MTSRSPILLMTAAIILLTLFSCKTSSSAFTKKDVVSTSKLLGLEFSQRNIDTMYPYLERNLRGYNEMRSHTLDHNVLPAILFDPIPRGFRWPIAQENCTWVDGVDIEKPDDIESLAYASISELGYLIRSGDLTSESLTRMYIKRIKKYDPTLKCVITLLEEDGIRRAQIADEEIKAGNYLGPLHGIPYGIKDLASVAGHKTTWGAEPYKNQVLDETATVVKKLEEAGAVLIAKLTSGALARGDVWFGGQTVNPWDTLQGASGSSAGSGSATSAGLVGFSLGTETLGSITSPSTRNGVTGLRPTYGRVSRAGVMALSWSMDKVGPICRSAADCAIVFAAIQGKDEMDPMTFEGSFCYEGDVDVSELRVGYLDNLFEKDTSERGNIVKEALLAFKDLGVEFTTDSLPSDFPFQAFDVILRAEAGAFFDDLIRSGGVDKMVQQTQRSRANSLRQARFIPAVEYIQANRYRRILIEEMHTLMSQYDVVVTPTFGGNQLMITNLTGHPVVTVPTGLDKEGHPTSVTFIGNLFQEKMILKLAQAFQEVTKWDEMQPEGF